MGSKFYITMTITIVLLILASYFAHEKRLLIAYLLFGCSMLAVILNDERIK